MIVVWVRQRPTRSADQCPAECLGERSFNGLFGDGFFQLGLVNGLIKLHLRNHQTDQKLPSLWLELGFSRKELQIASFGDQKKWQNFAVIARLQFFQPILCAKFGLLDDGLIGKPFSQRGMRQALAKQETAPQVARMRIQQFFIFRYQLIGL